MPTPSHLDALSSTAVLNVPVTFFVFNRPAYTKRVWDVICQIRPSKLLIVADGPRNKHPDDIRRCAEVRQIVTTALDWPCERQTLFAETNLGCKMRVASGLKWAFEQVEESIILEDDCVPDLTFFPFCQELLARYRDDPRVGMITGTNYRALNNGVPTSSYFASRHFSIWGWATWRRAFIGYDEHMHDWRKTKHPRDLFHGITHRPTRFLFRTMFDLAREGGVDTWDIAWVFHLTALRAVSLVAANNLVTNIGIEGTRGRKNDPNQLRPAVPMEYPLHHPLTLEPDPAHDRLVTARHRPIRDWVRGLWTHRIKRMLGSKP